MHVAMRPTYSSAWSGAVKLKPRVSPLLPSSVICIFAPMAVLACEIDCAPNLQLWREVRLRASESLRTSQETRNRH